MNTNDCRAAHKRIQTPVIDNANICAGGQEGLIANFSSLNQLRQHHIHKFDKNIRKI